jgi:anti-sigma regulatory factor (Ser/Thr protein kinase)
MNDRLSLDLVSSVSDLQRLQQAFGTFADRNELPRGVRDAFGVALEEMILNVINHGYQGRDDRPIAVDIAIEKSEVVVAIDDWAPPFDPLTTPTPDVSLPLEQRKTGGLGTHLTRGLMDRIEYQRTGDRNRLVLMKRM